MIILTAGIDLAVGAICILSMLFMANLAANNGVPGVLALLLGIAFGTLCGLLNGLLVTRLNLPPFIVTLGTLSIFTAIGLLYSGGASVGRRDMPPILNAMGTPIPLGPFRLTVGVLFVILLAVVVAFALSQTAWGRHLYAVGDDIEAARLVGIRVDRVLLSVYTVAGLIYGLTAWALIGRAGTASPNAIVDANLETITAVVIGGTSLFGGRGGIIGTMLGALIVYAFNIGLSLAGVDDQLRVLAIGVLDHRRRRCRPVDSEGEGMTHHTSYQRAFGRGAGYRRPRGAADPGRPQRRPCSRPRGLIKTFGKVIGLDGVDVDLFPARCWRSSGTTGPASRP